MKLYGFGPGRSLRALWVLNELNLDFEFVSVDLRKGEHQLPDFLKLNPAAKIPVLVDGDCVVTESVAIVLYLAEKFPEKMLFPTGLKERAEVYRWIMFAATELEQPLWRIARNTFLYPEDKRQPLDIAIARSEFTAMASVLEAHMQGRAFICGASFSVVDCVTAYLVDWANENSLLTNMPNLQNYLERMYARAKAPPRIRQARAAVAGAA
jgi:glutathione S-transferase